MKKVKQEADLEAKIKSLMAPKPGNAMVIHKGRRYMVVGIEGRVLTLQRCDKFGKLKNSGKIKILGTLHSR